MHMKSSVAHKYIVVSATVKQIIVGLKFRI